MWFDWRKLGGTSTKNWLGGVWKPLRVVFGAPGGVLEVSWGVLDGLGGVLRSLGDVLEALGGILGALGGVFEAF